MKRIEEICHYNAFGQGGFGTSTSTSTEENVTGIWIATSFINHSCVDGNSVWFRNGYFIFVRAFYDIPKGQEILISYLSLFETVPHKSLQKYGFTCDCRLCVRDRQDNSNIQNYRSSLQTKLATLFKKLNDRTNIDFQVETDVLKILKLLDNSRVDAPELNISFMIETNSLTSLYYENRSFLKCATTLEKVYNVIESIAALWYFTLTTIINILTSYLMAGEEYNAKQWFEVLKRKTILYYGSLSVIEVLAPNAVLIMEEFGLYSRELHCNLDD